MRINILTSKLFKNEKIKQILVNKLIFKLLHIYPNCAYYHVCNYRTLYFCGMVYFALWRKYESIRNGKVNESKHGYMW